MLKITILFSSLLALLEVTLLGLSKRFELVYTSPKGYHLPFFSYTLEQLKASWWLCFSTCSFPLCPGLDFAESRAKQIYIYIYWYEGLTVECDLRERRKAPLPSCLQPLLTVRHLSSHMKWREGRRECCPPRPVTKDPSYASWSVDLAVFQAGHVWAHRRFRGHFILFCSLTGTGLGGESDSRLPRTSVPGDWNMRRQRLSSPKVDHSRCPVQRMKQDQHSCSWGQYPH